MVTLKELLKSIHPVFFIVHSIKFPKASRLIKPSVGFLGFLFFLYCLFYYYVLRDLPSPTVLATRSIPQTTHIRDRTGVELYKIYSSQNRTLVKLSDLPSFVKNSTLAIEDKDFYKHPGFSAKGLVRAVVVNLTKLILDCKLTIENCEFTPQGGSTITQQLVKTSLLSPEKTLIRKIRELILSVAVESKYSKDQILEMYLNRVSYGGSSYGIEEAAQTYFGVSASQLTLAQSSLLAGLPASPTTYSPHGSHPEIAKERQKEVLNQMILAGFISLDQAKAASATALVFKPPRSSIIAPHFVMYVKDLLSQKYGPAVVEQGGLDVTTSLDVTIQTQVQKIVSEEVAKITHLHIQNGAALVTRPKSGEILAMVGSVDYFNQQIDGNVNVTLRSRQPGSSIKPINYALAFIKEFTPSSLIDDSPITYQISGQPPYSPINYDHKYHGKVSLRTALASSYNIPAVKLLAANGVSNMVDLAKNLGITTWKDTTRFGLSLTLGGGEVTMVDLATAYGVFANQGQKVSLNPILSVKDSTGHTLETAVVNPLEVLSSAVAFLISDILSDNSARTPTFGSRSLLFIPNTPVSVKTGTTNNLRDNWTIGYTSDFLAAVWVGNNDNSPMSYVASGVTGASPIWRKITDFLLTKYPFTPANPPESIVKVNVCHLTGQLGCDLCPGKPEYYISGTQPKNHCSQESLQRIKPTSPPGQLLPPATVEKPISTSPTPKLRPSSPPRRRFVR